MISYNEILIPLYLKKVNKKYFCQYLRPIFKLIKFIITTNNLLNNFRLLLFTSYISVN